MTSTRNKLGGKGSRGFTLLELIVALALFLILSGPILGGLAGLQKNYRSAEVRTAMQQRVRATMELMSQEIGQAGLQASTVDANGVATATGAPIYITQTIAANYSGAVSVSSATGVYVGEWLQVDGGSYQDPIQVTAVNTSTTPPTISAQFDSKGHTYTTAPGIPAYPLGIFPHGIVSGTSGTNLEMFGEFNGPGQGLYAVEYKCPTTGTGSFTRQEWSLTPSYAASTAVNMIDNVSASNCYFCFPNSAYTPPGASGNVCPTGAAALNFVQLPVPAAYLSASSATTCPPSGPSNTTNACTYTMVTQIGFTITVSEIDPTSGIAQLPITITKSYSNVQPRNIIAANNIYNLAVTTATNYNTATGSSTSYSTYLNGELQPDPPALVSVSW